MAVHTIYVGSAGWSIPKEQARFFPAEGSHLERYAARLPAVEINTSFYRPHQPQTYARWAESVPDHFQFAVKMSKAITHVSRLWKAEPFVDSFVLEVNHLGAKLGSILIQLPPSLGMNPDTAEAFFTHLRQQFKGSVVCEPRHRSWFTDEANQILIKHQVARVAADPAAVPTGAEPGGWRGLTYYRLHGSPIKYYSPYSPEYLTDLGRKLQTASQPVWCIFDNTAVGAAPVNALALVSSLSRGS